MEQATNLFNKGLLMDTHPMVQSNDSLTDCLNGTLITMNGNEVILQNDMGNRRVDNAFLPAGYEPVGMKEYGGIIYIAAYNPITNKSQIGSFPSPERKISGMDEEVLSKKTFDYNLDRFSYLTKEKVDPNKYRFITGDTLLFPLTDKTTLHAGDKFTVYGNIGNTNNISNYHNIKDDKVYSPKNRLYTFSIGVLNSQNEFVDITKSLVRWDEDSTIHKFNETDTDLYKFNYLYFIPETFKNTSLAETMNDANFIEERQKIAANTYSYKLIGPLYLKIQLNHFLKFNYSITGHKNLDGKTFTLLVEGYYIYNCPDGLTESELYNTYDDNYRTYEEGKIDPSRNENKWFMINGNNGTVTNSENITYNPETNLYTVKVTKTFEFNLPNPDNDGKRLFKYYLNVYINNHSDALYNNDGYTYFFDGLSDEGVIDIDKLGSGEIEIKEWRFYNYSLERRTNLKYQITAYNFSDDPFTNIYLIFKNVLDSNETVHTTENIPATNNSSGINISWDSVGLAPQKLYSVEMVALTSKGYRKEIGYVGWVLTTDLFNECFGDGTDKSISDFRYPSEGRELDVFNDKTTIKYELNLGITDESSFETLSNLDNLLGWLSMNDKSFNIKYKHRYNLKLNCIPKLQVINEEYYPKQLIKSELQIDDMNLFVKGKNGENENLFLLLNETIKNNCLGLDLLNEVFVEDPIIQLNGNIISGTINFYDIFYSDRGTPNFNVRYLFSNGCGKLENKIIKGGDNNRDLTNFEYTFPKMYGGINVFCKNDDNNEHLNRIEVRKIGTGGPDLYTPTNSKSLNKEREENNGDLNNNTTGNYLRSVAWSNSTYGLFSYSGLANDSNSEIGLVILELFSSNDFFKDGVLIYMFHPISQTLGDTIGFTKLHNYPEINLDPWNHGEPVINYSHQKSRVWWKNTNDGWTLIYDETSEDLRDDCVLDKNSNISTFLAKYVFKKHDDFIYCYRHNFNFENSIIKIFAPDKNYSKYNDEYSIGGEIIKFVFSNNSSLIGAIDNNINELIRSNLNFDFKTQQENKLYEYLYTLKELNSSFELKRLEIVDFFKEYCSSGFDTLYINYDGSNLITSSLDKNGNKLNSGFVYVINDGGLISLKRQGYLFRLNGDYYTLICDSSKILKPRSSDQEPYIYSNGLIILNPLYFKYDYVMDIRRLNPLDGLPIVFVYNGVPITIPTDEIEYNE